MTPAIDINPSAVDALVEPILRAGRVPGVALAVVIGEETVYAAGHGFRDLLEGLRMTAETRYPIASTTKALNALLLGVLVEEGVLSWDERVQHYLPSFQLGDLLTSAQVTVRDLVVLRTGLPRHDWVWLDSALDRAELVQRLRHLELSAGVRERFQYNNLTATAAGHIAEVVTNRSWEILIQERLLGPLQMTSTTFGMPDKGDVTASYHETLQRTIVPSERLATAVTSPSGGSIHSTVSDMARWVSLNLNGGDLKGRRIVTPETLRELHTPQVLVGADTSAPAPEAMYCLGWFKHRHNGHDCLSHGGHLHDVDSHIAFFPQERLGIVCVSNFGPPTLAKFINFQLFDSLMGLVPVLSLKDKLAEYEGKVTATAQRNASIPRVGGTAPSHALIDYAGVYTNPGYGRVVVEREDRKLVLQRNQLRIPLEHWHYDTWAPEDIGRFWIHAAHAFERANLVSFETNIRGEMTAVRLAFEPLAEPIRFVKVQGESR